MTKPHLIMMKGTDLVDSKGAINDEALDTFMAAIDNAFGIEAQEHLAGKHDQKSHGRRGSGGGGGGGALPEVEEWDAVGGGGGGMEVLNDQSVEYMETASKFAGEDIKVRNRLMNDEIRSNLKKKVVDEIAAESGVKSSTVDQFIHSWTESSSDDNVMSIGLQAAVAEKFGLELPPHIKSKMKEMGMDESWIRVPAQLSGDSHLVESRKVVDAIYNRTQRDLEARGVEEMHLVRGMDFSPPVTNVITIVGGKPAQKKYDDKSLLKPPEIHEFDLNKSRKIETDIRGRVANVRGMSSDRDWMDERRTQHRRNTYSESIDIDANPISSYTTDRHTFGLFGGNQTQGYGFAVRVPRKRILSTPFTGIGSLPEFEFVVIGGRTKSKVYGGEALWNAWPRRRVDNRGDPL